MKYCNHLVLGDFLNLRNKPLSSSTQVQTFFNFTKYDLSPLIPLFSLGAKHIPIPADTTDDDIRHGFARFKHNTLWANFHHIPDAESFQELEDNDDDDWNPRLRWDKTAFKTCNYIRQDTDIQQNLFVIEKAIDRYLTNNRPSRQQRTISTKLTNFLKSFPDIVVKSADKNIGLVALSIFHYNDLVMEHLGDADSYELISVNRGLNSNSLLLKSLVQKLIDFDIKWNEPFNSYFSKAEAAYLTEAIKDNKFDFPKFHCLPKVHKQGKLTGRPIAGAISFITTPIAIILDERLKPLLDQATIGDEDDQLAMNILKNANQLVSELEQRNDIDFHDQDEIDNIYIVTGDVKALYPSINLDKLQHIVDDLDPSGSVGFLTAFAIRNGYVQYDGQIYKQKKGIAMGLNSAVTLANLYLARQIDPIIRAWKQVHFFRRYIDDIFLIWKGSLAQWDNFKSTIANTDRDILIEWTNPSRTQIDFLDVNIYRCPVTLKFITSVYQKPLNKYTYISEKSCHPSHTFSGFIKGELTRYSRLNTHVTGYKIVKRAFYSRLRKRGYSNPFLRKIFKANQWADRFTTQTKAKRNAIALVIPFSLRRNLSHISKILTTYSSDFKRCNFDRKPELVYKNQRSLGSIITSSAITPSQSQLLSDRRRGV